MQSLGERIRELRCARGIHSSEIPISRSQLSKVEHDHVNPHEDVLMRICDGLQVGIGRLFASQEQFDGMMALEDRFVLAVIPFLKQLNAEQKKTILITLEAAPKQEIRQVHRPRFASTAKPILNASSRYTPQTVSTFSSQI